MNTTFNIQRFGKLFVNEWRVNKNKLLLYIGGMLACPILLFLFLVSIRESMPYFMGFVLLCLQILIFHGLFIALFFNEFTSKTETQAQLLLPTSRAETFWAKFAHCLIIYPILAFIYIWAMMHVMEFYNDWATKTLELGYTQNLLEYKEFLRIPIVIPTLLCIWLFTLSLFTWGANHFRKWVFVKTVITTIVSFFALIPVTYLMYTIFSGHTPDLYIPFILAGDSNGFYSLFSWNPYYMHWIGISSSIFLLVIARLKFNEKTI